MDSVCCKDNRHAPRNTVSYGKFFRKSDGHWINRFKCLSCCRTFSTATDHPNFKQRRRDINEMLYKMLVSGISQRRASKILEADRKTIVRRFRLFAKIARQEHKAFQSSVSGLSIIQFDDLETAEHTKCKPISVALAVEPSTRKILSYQASQMPAKGHLAKIARLKYPPRPDKRSLGWNRMFNELASMVRPTANFISDENPHYPRHLLRVFPKANHETHKGRKPSVAGQGELKKVIFDPLFSLNHTCAMLRANINRLFRKTWCISKTIQGLEDHLALYVRFHNQELTEPITHTAL